MKDNQVVAFGLILFVVLLLIAACDKSPTVTLHTSEWACTNMRTIPLVTYVKTGDVIVPIITPIEDCIQWTKQP